MPTINGLGAQNFDAGYAASKPRSTQLSPDDFMKLFITQLQHQNPTSPMDSSTMLQQMANLGQLNAAQQAQDTMKDMKATMQATLTQSQAIGATQLIGKKVILDSKGISPMIPKEGITGVVALPSAASNVIVSIKDSAGKEIKKIELGPSASDGLIDYHWDGMIDGKEVPADFYHVSAVAVVNGKEVGPLKTAGAFKINSVGLDSQNSTFMLNVNGLGGQPMKNIIKILG